MHSEAIQPGLIFGFLSGNGYRKGLIIEKEESGAIIYVDVATSNLKQKSSVAISAKDIECRLSNEKKTFQINLEVKGILKNGQELHPIAYINKNKLEELLLMNAKKAVKRYVSIKSSVKEKKHVLLSEKYIEFKKTLIRTEAGVNTRVSTGKYNKESEKEISVNNQISIGIATKNNARRLSLLLESLPYSAKDIPIFASDNNSSDETEKIIKNYKARLNIQYFRHKKDLHIGGNLNSLMDICKTPFMLLISDDALFLPYTMTYYKQLILLLQSSFPGISAIYVNRFLFSSKNDYLNILSGIETEVCPEEKDLHIFKVGGYIDYVAATGNGGHQPGMLINMDLVKKGNISFFTDGGDYVDKLFFLNANKNYPVAYCRKPAICCRAYLRTLIGADITRQGDLFVKKATEILGNNSEIIEKIKAQRMIRACIYHNKFNACFAHNIAVKYGIDRKVFLKSYPVIILEYFRYIKKRLFQMFIPGVEIIFHNNLRMRFCRSKKNKMQHFLLS